MPTDFEVKRPIPPKLSNCKPVTGLLVTLLVYSHRANITFQVMWT